MGEVADTLTKKKKKGRPSFIEVQKRALKQQELLQQKKDAPKEELRSGFKNPNSGSRYNRRKYYPNEASDEDDDDDDYYDDKKRRKNQRLLHGFNSNDRLRSSNLKSNGCDFDDNASIRRRIIGGTGSDDKKIDDSKDELRSGFKNPNSGSRSNRRKYNLNEASEEDDDDDDDDDKRRRKKQRLLHGLNSNDRLRSSNVKSDGCDFDDNASIRRRIIGATGSDDKLQKASKGTDILQRSLVESGPFTPLPDKKLLLFIVDRLQKKDTYGVYSDPVDPEELPDYHDIITNPMDFSTLRKKLESGAYTSLEQFEQDVFLICTNAMEYNSADTVYFRQARAMLEIAKKDFENLRQESDEEEEEPVTLSQQPTTGIKKQPEPSSVDTAHILGGDYSRLCGAYNLRRTPPYRFRQAETWDRINHHNSENQNGSSIDWEKEFPPSVVKAVEKIGMKNVENRRDTYNHDSDSTSLQEASIFTTFDDDLKQLTPVGLRNEYGYAMSLARFAAKLGPVAWRFANKRTETSLPNGIGFGFGENQEAPPNDLASDDHLHSSRIIMSQTTSVSSIEAARLLNQESESNGLVRALTGFNNNQNQMVETALSRQGLLLPPNRKQEFTRFRPDLNVKLVSPNSPSL
uniref:Bromodomain and PHD finger-containing protein 3 n=1 Tax=Noccaea caerulescens TaxID=107243 RepID=A0A1J3H705_NOCCA